MIRTARSDDIVHLSEYWYDNQALRLRSHPVVRLVPDARRLWETRLQTLLGAVDTSVLVYVIDDKPLACIIGQLTDNVPGLAPKQYCTVEDLFFDLHTTHSSDRIASELLAALGTTFATRNIKHLKIDVATGSVVAQAFWYGKGARKTDYTFWMTI